MSNFRISVTQIWHSGIPHIGTNSSRFLYSHEIFHLVNYFSLIFNSTISGTSGWGWNKTMFSWLSDQRYNFLVSKQIKKDFRTLVTYDHFLVISDKLKSHIPKLSQKDRLKNDRDESFCENSWLFCKSEMFKKWSFHKFESLFYFVWDKKVWNALYTEFGSFFRKKDLLVFCQNMVKPYPISI